MRKSRKFAIVAGSTVGALAIGGVAFAYWTQGGSGGGSGTTGTTSAITVNQLSSVSDLYPGSTPQALSGDFDNPNPGAVAISSVTAAVTSVLNGAANVDAGHPACTTGDFAIGGTSGSNLVPTGGAGVGSWSGLTLQLVNSAANQDNCKNATAVITYTANP